MENVLLYFSYCKSIGRYGIEARGGYIWGSREESSKAGIRHRVLDGGRDLA